MTHRLHYLLPLVVLLSGCSLVPMGVSVDQWASMSPAQQEQARREHARQDEALRKRREQRQSQPGVSSREHSHEQAQRLRQAVPGDVLHCVLNRVKIKTRRDTWRAAHSAGIELLQGESQKLILKRSNNTGYPHRTLRILFEQDSLLVCDRSALHCNRLTASPGELQRGKQGQLDTGTVRAQLKCQYPPQFWHPE